MGAARARPRWWRSAPGTALTVIDPDGGQPAELTALAPDGREDLGGPGRGADAPATVLRGLVSDGSGDGFLSALHARGLKPHDARARAAVRPGRRRRRLAVVHGRARRAGRGGRSGRAGRPSVGCRRRRSSSSSSGPRPRDGGRPRAAAAAGRAAARLPGRQGLGAGLRGPRGRVHPDHRREGQAVLGLPRLQRAQAPGRPGARAGRRDHAHADGHRGPHARPVREVLRRRP